MDDETTPIDEALRRPVLAWVWRPNNRDEEPGVVEARLSRLVADGVEALVLVEHQGGSEALRSLWPAACQRRLQVVEEAAVRGERLWPGLSDQQIEDLAHRWLDRTDLDAIVCDGSEEDAAGLLATARRLRRRLDRLAWQHFQ